MRSLLLLAAAVGLASFTAAPDRARELRIVVPEGGVLVEPAEGYSVRLGGPTVSIVLTDEMTLDFNDLDRPTVSARLDFDTGRSVWKGSYEIEVRESGVFKGRIRVHGATLVLGRFEEGESWEGLDD